MVQKRKMASELQLKLKTKHKYYLLINIAQLYSRSVRHLASSIVFFIFEIMYKSHSLKIRLSTDSYVQSTILHDNDKVCHLMWTSGHVLIAGNQAVDNEVREAPNA